MTDTPPVSAGRPSSGPGHFLDLADFTGAQLRAILAAAREIKGARAALPGRASPDPEPLLAGRVVALIFEQVSTRTRVSFDVGVRQMGGETLFLTGDELQLGRGESIADTARVLSRYVDAIAIRILSHSLLQELAAASAIPVVNGLTKHSHPCQIMADIMTFEEHRGPIAGKRLAWIGDANNVLTSFIHAAPRLGFGLSIACAKGYGPAAELIAKARAGGADIALTHDPREAAEGADGIVTDTWVSLGDEMQRHERMLRLEPFRVDAKLMGLAAKDAVFLHCLPAHRGEEVTAEVIDGPRSLVWDEAENRLHVQKAVLAWCMGKVSEHGAIR